MSNELTTGTRRTGNLIDFDPDTPHVHVTLERSADGISLTIPWSGEDSPYSAWFDGDGSWRRTRNVSGSSPTSLPKRLLFHDSHGSVMLIGCWARGFHATVGGPGSGTVWARAAILGVVRVRAKGDDPERSRLHRLSGHRTAERHDRREPEGRSHFPVASHPAESGRNFGDPRRFCSTRE